MKGRARDVYVELVRAAHAVLQEETEAANTLWDAMGGRSHQRGAAHHGFEVRCLELVIARRGAGPQFTHQDVFTSEWLQWQLYVTGGRSATVRSVFRRTRATATGSVIAEGDAAAAAYLREQRARETLRITHGRHAGRDAVSDAEFERRLRRDASLVAIGLQGGTEVDRADAIEAPVLPGEIGAGTLQVIRSEELHRAPGVREDEEARILMIWLGNKAGDDRGVPPAEALQKQSAEQAAQLALIDTMLASDSMMRQAQSVFLQSLAAKGYSVLTKTLWQRLVAVRARAEDDPERVTVANAARVAVRTYHDRLAVEKAAAADAAVDADASDDELVDEEEPGSHALDAKLTRAWRRINEFLRLRSTHATHLAGAHVHNWTPHGREFGEGEEKARDWTHPGSQKKYNFDRSNVTGIVKKVVFRGRYRLERGLVTNGKMYIEMRDGTVIPVGAGTLLEIKAGLVCNFIVTQKVTKEYAYYDCKGERIGVTGPKATEDDETVDDPMFADEMLFPYYQCEAEGCEAVCWDEGYETAANGCTRVWCADHLSAANAALPQGQLPRRMTFGMPAADDKGTAACGCPICVALPDGFTRNA